MRPGVTDDALDGTKPIIGIFPSWSEPACNAQLDQVADQAKLGNWEFAGVPFVFPAMSARRVEPPPDAHARATIMAMAVEESIRANPWTLWSCPPGRGKTTAAMWLVAFPRAGWASASSSVPNRA